MNDYKISWLGWIVLIAWASSLASGLLAGHLLSGDAKSAMGTWGRMGSSIALVALACLAWVEVVPQARRFASWVAVGMGLGTIGDFFNADLLTFIPLKDGTMGAMVAFGLGHLCYITAIGGEIRKYKYSEAMVLCVCVVCWQVIGLLSWYLIVFPAAQNKNLIWPALGYTLLLAGTAGAATGLAYHSRRMWPLAVGAGLFLASDLLLAIGMFRGSFPFRSEAVWLTYGPGQMLIVISSWLVMTNSRCAETDRQ